MSDLSLRPAKYIQIQTDKAGSYNKFVTRIVPKKIKRFRDKTALNIYLKMHLFLLPIIKIYVVQIENFF